MIKKLTLILIVVFFVSCNKDKKNYIFSEFPKTEKLESVDKYGANLPYKFNHIVTDGKYIFTTHSAGKSVLEIFDGNDFKHILSVGNTGKGPNEIVSPAGLYIDDGNIYIYDFGKRRISYYEIDKLFQLETPQLHTFLKELPDEIGYLSDYKIDSKKKLLYASVGCSHMLTVFNKNGIKINEIGDYIYTKKEDEPCWGVATLFQNKFIISEKHNRLIFSFNFWDKILVMDTCGKTIRKTVGPDFIEQHHTFVPKYGWRHTSKDLHAYGYKPLIYDDHIFSLYSGLPATRRVDYSIVPNYFRQLFVFDINGIPVVKYDLDMEVTKIIILNNKLVAIPAENDYLFAVYDLPKF